MAEQQSAKTMHDIASLIRTPAEQETIAEPVAEEVPLDEGNPEEAVTETADDAVEADDLEEVLEDDTSEEINETSEEGDDEEEAGDDDADDHTEDDDGYLNVRDDDMIEVKVDGEVVLRSIADAKKALSGEGAIDKRLKEATEARKQAQADHTMLLEQFSIAHKNLMSTVEGMENIVFKPTVQKPDAALRQTNPQEYLLQVDAYEADQQRVADGKKAIRALIDEQNNALSEDIEKYRQQQATALLESVPELKDEEQAPKLLQSMSKLAMERYGYSPQEIQQASDHRLYRMMYDLSQFYGARDPANRKANTAQKLEGQRNKRPRTLRSGATALKSKARKQSEAQKQVANKARQSGKVKDVAQTLIKKG